MDILSTKRIDFSTDAPEARSTQELGRTDFDMDVDRIVFSDAFRRLQDKTQVHGPAGNDYVRSRLTHSMEVSRVGRHLGYAFGTILARRAPELAPGHQPHDFGQAVAAACLMHDIGNPPFGHTGEKAISEFFTQTATGREAIQRLEDHPLAREAQCFEGNAQGLRTVVRLQGWRADGGLGLTAATLAAFAKYPFGAGGPRSEAKKKKYGFFREEHGYFAAIADATSMHGHPDGGWKRHPLAYLVEAADDTCYRIVDVEDGYVMNCLPFEEAEGHLMSVAGDPGADYRDIPTRTKKLVRLRSLAISGLVRDVTARLEDNFEKLIAGDHAGDLVLETPAKAALDRIDKMSRAKIYAGPERLRIDLIAHRTIATLLDAYLQAFMEREDGKQSAWGKSVLKSFPHADRVGKRAHDYVRAALDHVSGMTDDYAQRQAQPFSTPSRSSAA